MLRAFAAGVAALLSALQPIGIDPCPGVRPGARVIIVDRTWCTANFLFKGSDGTRYIGTAGHCLVDGGTTTFPKDGYEITTPEDQPIGATAYARLDGHNDFGLIRIDKGVEIDPEMCHFGGPTGIFTGESSEPVVLHHYGHGVASGYLEAADHPLVPARTAIAPSIRDSDTVGAVGWVTPGDSGSPVIDDDGRAIGVVVAIGGEGMSPVGIKRLGPQLELAEEALGIRLRLLIAAYPAAP